MWLRVESKPIQSFCCPHRRTRGLILAPGDSWSIILEGRSGNQNLIEVGSGRITEIARTVKRTDDNNFQWTVFLILNCSDKTGMGVIGWKVAALLKTYLRIHHSWVDSFFTLICFSEATNEPIHVFFRRRRWRIVVSFFILLCDIGVFFVFSWCLLFATIFRLH